MNLLIKFHCPTILFFCILFRSYEKIIIITAISYLKPISSSLIKK